MAQLRKLYTRVQDSNSATVASPTVSVLRVGAEIGRDASVGTPTIGVRHPGALKFNDVCNVIRAGAVLSGVTVTIADATWTYSSGNGDWTSEISATGGYTITAGDRLVLTGDTSSHFVSLYDNDSKLGSATTAAVTAAASGLLEYWVDARDVDIKMVSGSTTSYALDISTEGRDYVTPQDFGAKGDGSNDDSGPINIAYQYQKNKGGGTVYFPAGTYKVNSEILVDDAFASNSGVFFRGEGINASSIVAGSNNINLVHWAGSWGGIDAIGLDGGGFTGVSGLRLTPVSESQTTTLVHQNYNRFQNMRIEDCAEGVVLQCGPDVGGTVSGCYFNQFDGVYINRCTRGIWFKDGPNLNASGANRNQFFGVRVGLSMNTGLQIDAGGTNMFFGVSFEEVQTGTSPNTTPTAIKILNTAPVGGRGNANNQFFGTAVENCTRDLDIENVSTEFYGHSIQGSKINVASASTIPNVFISSQSGVAPVQFKLQQYNNAMNDELGGGVPVTFVKGGTAPDSDAFSAPKGSVIFHTNGTPYVKQSSTGTDWNHVVHLKTPTVTEGTGTPEGIVTAPVGSMFLRTDGGASTTLYIKESGTGNTGWVAK